MQKSQFQINYSFRLTFRKFRDDFRLTYQQFFFLWYLVENRFTDRFKPCDLLIPGTSVRNTYYYVKVLYSRGYLNKNHGFYSFTDRAKVNFKRFMDHYKRSNSLPFKWSY